jgi:hypothetical protein
VSLKVEERGRDGDVITAGSEKCHSTGFEDGKGAMSQRMLVASGSQGKQGNEFSKASRRECSLADTLALAQSDRCWVSDLQNCKGIDLCCFKLLNL